MRPFGLGINNVSEILTQFSDDKHWLCVNDVWISFSVTEQLLFYTPWDELPNQYSSVFYLLAGGDPKQAKNFYKDLFLTYFPIHEVCHGLRAMYGKCEIKKNNTSLYYLEESIAHIISIAYWKVTSPVLVKKLTHISKIMLTLFEPFRIYDPTGKSFQRLLSESNFNFHTYMYYQAYMISNAISFRMSLDDALQLFLYNIPIKPDVSIEMVQLRNASPKDLVYGFIQCIQSHGYLTPKVTIIPEYLFCIQCLAY